MAEEIHQVPIYRLGDTIRIQFEVSDQSGVEEVVANFILRGPNAGDMYLVGNGGGSAKATIILEKEVDETVIPGEWTCFSLRLDDSLGNRSFSKPNIEFRVEGIPGDHEGPQLDGWQVLYP